MFKVVFFYRKLAIIMPFGLILWIKLKFFGIKKYISVFVENNKLIS